MQTQETQMSKALEGVLAKMAEADKDDTADALLDELSTITGDMQESDPQAAIEAELLDDLGELSAVELSDEELVAIEIGETRAEVYQAQSQNQDSVNIATPTQNKPARAAKKAAKPRVARDLNTLPDSVFVLIQGDDPAMSKTDVLANPPKQTKVVEKWENLFVSLNAGTKPSRYTVTGFTLLKQNGKVTTTEMVAAMKAEGMADGTARAQTGQIMALLPLVGVAIRNGQTLTLRQDSDIADRLARILGL